MHTSSNLWPFSQPEKKEKKFKNTHTSKCVLRSITGVSKFGLEFSVI